MHPLPSICKLKDKKKQHKKSKKYRAAEMSSSFGIHSLKALPSLSSTRCVTKSSPLCIICKHKPNTKPAKLNKVIKLLLPLLFFFFFFFPPLFPLFI